MDNPAGRMWREKGGGQDRSCWVAMAEWRWVLCGVGRSLCPMACCFGPRRDAGPDSKLPSGAVGTAGGAADNTP